ncbi:MAG: LPS export ABC transporter permease LptF [Acidobacteria bacterium]|nr:LPS export ABC transporter permease LptF [Acidobacteriota bacterium]
MRILTRYILRELLTHCLLGTAVFTFVLFMRDVGRILELVVRNSAPLPSVAEVFFLTLPAALTFTIPMGVLVGILIGLGRMAADSEITAMRAAGMGAGAFVQVVGIFAMSAWMLALCNTVWLAPRSAAALTRLQESLKSSQVPYEVQPRVFYEQFRNYVLYAQDVSAGQSVWQRIFLADVSTPSAPRITLAEEGTVVSEAPGTLRLLLKNGAQHDTAPRAPEQYSISTFTQTDLPIQLPQREATQPREAARLAQISSQELLAQAGIQAEPQQRAYLLEFHRRLSLPTACLALALAGIPLGLSAHKGGKSTGFVLAIVLVFVYYFVSLAGVSLARQGKVSPALGAWLANLAFLAGGLVLLWRVDRMPLQIPLLRNVFSAEKRRRSRQAEGRGGAFERAASRRRVFSANFPQIIDDYILRDFATYFVLVLGAFLVLSLVFTFFEMLGDIIRNRVPLITVGEFLVNFLPTMIYQFTPISVLIGVLVAFGLMEKHREVTAMKASGVSIYRVAFPVLVLAGVLSVGLFFFDHYYLPEAFTRQDALWNTIKGRPAQTYLRPDRKWIFGQHSSIYYYEFYDPDRLQFGGISVFLFSPETFQITRRIYATRADWEPGLGKWVFQRGWTRSFRGAAIEEYRRFDVATFEELTEPPSYFLKRVIQSSEMNYQELSAYIDDLEQSGFEVVRLKVQWHRKFAFPLITVVMAVLAVPFSLSAGRRGALAGVAVALGIAILYWVTNGLFEAMGNVSQLPPLLAAWSPDLLFALCGGYLILKLPT